MQLKNLTPNLFIFFLILFTACEPPAWTDYERDMIEYRYARDNFVKFGDASPLEEREKIFFVELSYYDIDSNYRLTAFYQPFEEQDTIDMPYQNGTPRPYIRKGSLSLDLDTLEVQLTAYQSVDADEDEPLFIPFKDYSCAFESFDGGRYMDLDLESSEAQKVILDLNKIYNPHCALNPKFKCPIPPEENYVPYHIHAGEKAYGKYKFWGLFD